MGCVACSVKVEVAKVCGVRRTSLKCTTCVRKKENWVVEVLCVCFKALPYDEADANGFERALAASHDDFMPTRVAETKHFKCTRSDHVH